MKPIITIAIFIACLQISGRDASCLEHEQLGYPEICRLDDNYVLLYKVINWWNDCLPEDAYMPCHNRIACQSQGGATIDYNNGDRVLRIQVDRRFAGLLSVFKECEHCQGPSSLEPVWLDKEIFGNGEAAVLRGAETNIHSLTFNAITREQAIRIKDIANDLAFVVEGRVQGLLLNEGRIALHQAGKFLKACPDDPRYNKGSFPISLKIVNSRTGEALVQYDAVYDDK